MTLLRRLLLLLPFILLGGISCTKEKDPSVTPAPPTTPALTLTATLDKASVTPGELVIITTSEALDPTKSSWEIMLGNRKVAVGRLDAKQAVFLVPILATGPVPLDLSPLGITSAPALTMAAYAPITDPDVVLQGFGARLTKALAYADKLSKDTLLSVPAQDVASMRSLQQQMATLQSQLSVAEKIEAAYVLEKLTFEQVDFASFPQRKTKSGTDPGEDFMTIGKSFVVSSISTTACIAVFVPLVAFPDPVSKFLACAVATRGILSLMTSLELIKMLCTRFDLIAEVNVLAKSGTGTLTLASDNLTACLLDAKARTLSRADGAGTAFMQQIFAANSKLEAVHARFTTAFTKVLSWFGDAKPPTPYVNPVKAAALQAKKSLAASLVKIQNVSNSAINLAVSTANNTLSLRASSATVKSKTPFTFDVVYENTELGISTKKTINAEFEVNDSTAFYQKAVLGNWVTVWYYNADGQFAQEDKIVLHEGGTGKRISTRYADGKFSNHTGDWGTDPFFEISWRVFKTGSNYYLSFFDNRWGVAQTGRIVYPHLKFDLVLANGYYRTKNYKE